MRPQDSTVFTRDGRYLDITTEYGYIGTAQLVRDHSGCLGWNAYANLGQVRHLTPTRPMVQSNSSRGIMT